ncbi:hypothetical protein Daura_02320 [Dactylosporangium aurantiacum]|uniref:Uncharacterized protein n=1 Tax=Dactylosporangium aurantiacum TaxID=35754 RepID=A0A9Q9ILC4_9ACTN|nr:hypothetical protein [Dactylosporangium aurantiacum]MDG6100799.1 hypothetical protein [Dactylosporangium aurantiacum]UWZ55138.1 hypothetical protein Daura_02320 [Dactylosporangium aurantiacum]
MALSAPDTLGSPAEDGLPWTLDGGRGILGLDPVTGALVLWAALMGVIVLFIIFAAILSRWSLHRINRAEHRAEVAEADASLSPAERARLRVEAGELIRQAAATAAAAKRAELEVVEAQARALAAQQAREVAWATFDVAQKAYEEALRAASAIDPDAPTDAEEDDKREISRAALAAFKRGDITVDALESVFRGASGWDPLHELQAREIELRRSAESRARRLYDAAAAAERAAVKAADVAVVAAHALVQEAAEVAAEAADLRNTLDAARQSAIVASTITRKKRRVPQQRTKNTRAAEPRAAVDTTVTVPSDPDRTQDLRGALDAMPVTPLTEAA